MANIFLTPRAALYYLRWCPRFFSPPFLQAETISWLKLKYFTSSSTCPDAELSRMVCGERATLLQERPSAAAESSALCLRLLKRPACSLHVARCVSCQPPYNATPFNDQPSASTVVLPPGKPPATEIDGENECRSFESAKNAEENKPAPDKERGSEGKSGRSLNRLERCPNRWKLVIGLYSREIGSLCLIHS